MMSLGDCNQSPLSESICSVDLKFNGVVFLTVMAEATDSTTALAFGHATSGNNSLPGPSGRC